jgi:hypothetical protein
MTATARISEQPYQSINNTAITQNNLSASKRNISKKEGSSKA